MGMLVGFWVLIGVLSDLGVASFELDELFDENKNAGNGLTVNLTLITNSPVKMAVCMDGTAPGYHLDRGSGPGANNWLIQIQGGGWCSTIESCVYRKTTHLGSSNFFPKAISFIGILSNDPRKNPDFYNWNRVMLLYCDGGSLAGNSKNETEGLEFRGRLIWRAAMIELRSKGMKYANQALLSGCSAGGLASILYCDKFQALFTPNTTVKCLSDAGLFMDAADVSGEHTLRRLFKDVVRMQAIPKLLTNYCPKKLSRTLCLFPQNLIANIKTPLFILNAAYDSWQIQASLATLVADPTDEWRDCKKNIALCSPPQMRFLQGFRNKTLKATKRFAGSTKNGLFINSCFAHCQTERQDTWFARNSPTIYGKRIATAVGDWYFNRSSSCMYIGCEEKECTTNCHNLVFK